MAHPSRIAENFFFLNMAVASGDCNFSFCLSWNAASSERPSWTALLDRRAPSRSTWLYFFPVCIRAGRSVPRGSADQVSSAAGFFSGASPVLTMPLGPWHVPSESLGYRGMAGVCGASFHDCLGARRSSRSSRLAASWRALVGVRGRAEEPRGGPGASCQILPRSPWHQGGVDRPWKLWARTPSRLGLGSSDTLVA